MRVLEIDSAHLHQASDARLTAADIVIGPDTATPDWHGERLDLGYAIDVLWMPRTAPGADAGGAQAQ